MNKRSFGKTGNKEAYLITLSSGGIKADVTNFGCAVVRLMAPDRKGELIDVVMGYDTLEEYVDQNWYAGTVIGRCANRIPGAGFSINGKTYRLSENRGNCHLHGGQNGFWNVLWEIRDFGEDYAVFQYLSPDGEEGYPGNLRCTVEYRLAGNRFIITYTGVSDADTVMNLTNHSYFNLNGFHKGTIGEHIVSIDADAITEIDEDCCSTGNIIPVEGTPFDLRSPRRIGDRLAAPHIQMEYGDGFNHNYVLNHRGTINALTGGVTEPGGSMDAPAINMDTPAASLFSPESRIEMKVFTDMEGMHFYTGNYLDGSIHGKNGTVYSKYGAACFETQHFPNAVNIPHFPPAVIKKGEEYRSTTVFQFDIK